MSSQNCRDDRTRRMICCRIWVSDSLLERLWLYAGKVGIVQWLLRADRRCRRARQDQDGCK